MKTKPSKLYRTMRLLPPNRTLQHPLSYSKTVNSPQLPYPSALIETSLIGRRIKGVLTKKMTKKVDTIKPTASRALKTWPRYCSMSKTNVEPRNGCIKKYNNRCIYWKEKQKSLHNQRHVFGLNYPVRSETCRHKENITNCCACSRAVLLGTCAFRGDTVNRE